MFSNCFVSLLIRVAESQNIVSRLFFIVEKVYIEIGSTNSTYKIEFDTKIHMIVLYADIILVLCSIHGRQLGVKTTSVPLRQGFKTTKSHIEARPQNEARRDI